MSRAIYSDDSAWLISLFQVADLAHLSYDFVVVSLYTPPVASQFSGTTTVPLSICSVGAQALCSLGSNVGHSRTSLQACRDPLES